MIADKAEKGRVTRMVRRHCEDVEWASGFGADYVAGGHVIERKRWAELPDRMTNNENDLHMQLDRLEAAADALGRDPVLLLEGPMAGTLGHTSIEPWQVQKYVAGAIDRGISTMTTLDEECTARVLERLDGPTASPDLSAVRDPDKVPEGERPRYVLEGVEGVGPGTARDLLGRFGSVEEVAAASEGELQEVEGVGPSTAGSVREAFGGVYEP